LDLQTRLYDDFATGRLSTAVLAGIQMARMIHALVQHTNNQDASRIFLEENAMSAAGRHAQP
jgi:hypothetical protein